MSELIDLEFCNSQWVGGPKHEPYATYCELARGHEGNHEGPSPLVDGVVRWMGGNIIAGDRRPSIVVHAGPSYEELAKAVMAYAEAHYADGGWDVVVEAWDLGDIARELREVTAGSPEAAIEAFRGVVSIWADRQADAKNSEF